MKKSDYNIKYKAVVSCIDDIYHHAIEDKEGFKVCAGLIKQDTFVDITNLEAKDIFIKYFEDEIGIRPFEKCPLCGEQTILKKKQGYFVGCSGWPKCNFLASSSQKFTNIEDYKSREEENKKTIEVATLLMNKEGEKLYEWIYLHAKFLESEKELVKRCKRRGFGFTHGQAKKALTIYKKALNLGYPNKHKIIF